MRGASSGVAHAEIDAGLPEVGRQQLRVAIGEMQQMNAAEARYVVDVCCSPGGAATTDKRETRRGRGGENLQEFAAIHPIAVTLSAFAQDITD